MKRICWYRRKERGELRPRESFVRLCFEWWEVGEEFVELKVEVSSQL